MEEIPVVLHMLCAIANTSKAPTLLYKAQILKLSIEALTPTKLGQLCQELENISWGCTTMAASVWVSQRNVDYKEVEAT